MEKRWCIVMVCRISSIWMDLKLVHSHTNSYTTLVLFRSIYIGDKAEYVPAIFHSVSTRIEVRHKTVFYILRTLICHLYQCQDRLVWLLNTRDRRIEKRIKRTPKRVQWTSERVTRRLFSRTMSRCRLWTTSNPHSREFIIYFNFYLHINYYISYEYYHRLPSSLSLLPIVDRRRRCCWMWTITFDV